MNNMAAKDKGELVPRKSVPFIFLFTGESGKEYGYKDDYRGDGLFWYTGEGRRGDMQMVRGNRAILDHEMTGRVLHLFRSLKKGWVQYIGEARCLEYLWEPASDLDGRPRKAIVFRLDVQGSDAGRPFAASAEEVVFDREVNRLWKRPIKELRQLAYEAPIDSGVPMEHRIRNVYRRSAGVKAYVLRRANGICEGCRQPAPFKMPNGRFYLEPHHIRRLADEGPDHPRWVAALCPNCHRRVHHGADGTEFNQEISRCIEMIEEIAFVECLKGSLQ